MEHALPLAQPKLLKGIQLYFAELDIQSMLCLPLLSNKDNPAHKAMFVSCKKTVILQAANVS